MCRRLEGGGCHIPPIRDDSDNVAEEETDFQIEKTLTLDTAHLRIIIRSELQGDNLLESNFMSLIITLYVRIKAASAQVIRA